MSKEVVLVKLKRVRQEGVTLIELIVTVVVIAILATIAVPSFSSFFERQRLVGAASALNSEIQFARAESLKRDEVISLTVMYSTPENWCFGSVASSTGCDCTNNSCQIDSVTRTYSVGDFPGTSATASPTNLNTYVFEPIRGTVSNNVNVTFTHSSGNSLIVVTTKLGRSSICAPSESNANGYEEC